MNGVLPVSFLCTSMFSDAQDIFLLNMKAEKKKKHIILAQISFNFP